jgi:hypothetical protein
LEDVNAGKNCVESSFEVAVTLPLLLPGESIQINQRLRLCNQSRIIRDMVVFDVVAVGF